MAWNQQGPENKDPWGQGNGQSGPPDLDQVIRDIQKKLSGIFGKSSSRGGGGGGSGGLIFISARTITNNGTIRSIGGDGGNGKSSATAQ